jgi:hypothetical protein
MTTHVLCMCCCSVDEGANPAHVAADLLSQAEHGPDSQVVLLALPGVDLDAVQLAVQRQCDELPRNETARKALSHSCVVQVGGGEGGLRLPAVGCHHSKAQPLFDLSVTKLGTEDAGDW